MKNYDFERAKQLVESQQDQIDSASMGMFEDWFWTAETVFENGNWKNDLNPNTNIGGINRSEWATPTLEIRFKDGRREMIDCFTQTVIPNEP